MSSFGHSIWDKGRDPTEVTGKMHQKHTIKDIGQDKQSSYLRSRMKADDSAAVNMSDSKLGGGVRQTGSAK